MILLSLKLQNFKKYKELNIEFSLGLIGILGKNGSGKSTIFEAILFALYGELKNKGYKDIIRNAKASIKDAVCVELSFEYEACTYRVKREFRGKNLSASAHFYKNEELLCSGVKEVTSYISTLSHMNKEAFLSTLFASQKELNSLSSLKNEDRKKMIRKLLGLEKIDFVEKELIEKSRALKREISAYDEVLLSKEEKQNKTNKQKELKEEKNKKEKERVELKEKLLQKKEKEQGLKKELDVYQVLKEEKVKAFNTYTLVINNKSIKEKYLSKVLVEIESLKKKEKELQVLEPVKKEYIDLYESMKVFIKEKEISIKKEALIKEQEHLRLDFVKYKEDVSILELECKEHESLILKEQEQNLLLNAKNKEVRSIEAKEKSLHVSIRSQEKQIEQNKEKIHALNSLGKSSPCPVCTRPLLEEYDKVLESLALSIKELQENKINEELKSLSLISNKKENVEKDLHHLQKEAMTLSQRINLIESKKKDLLKVSEHFFKVKEKGLKNKEELLSYEKSNYNKEKHEQANTRYQDLKEKYEYVLSLETMLIRADNLKKEKANTQEELSILSAREAKSKTEHESILYDEVKHSLHQDNYVKEQKEYESIHLLFNAQNVLIATLEGEIKTLEAILEKNETHAKKVQNKKDDLLDYEKIKVSLLAFKNKLNAKISPRISQLASSLFERITKGKYQHIEVNNEFDFFIYEEGIKYPLERFSGGEIDLANLVLRISISKTLSELNNSSSMEFMAFDEVFGSQDENRRLEILEAFHTIKEQYRQIFLISHETDIKEMFETVIEV